MKYYFLFIIFYSSSHSNNSYLPYLRLLINKKSRKLSALKKLKQLLKKKYSFWSNKKATIISGINEYLRKI